MNKSGHLAFFFFFAFDKNMMHTDNRFISQSFQKLIKQNLNVTGTYSDSAENLININTNKPSL